MRLNFRCAKIQYEIDYTHVYGRVRVIKDEFVCTRSHKIEKALYKRRTERRQELLLDRSSCSLLSRWLVHLLSSTKTRKYVLISQYVLKT